MDVGTRVSVAGEVMEVVRHLGTGAEGEVFELAGSERSRPLALKWFHAPKATADRRASIADLVARGAPNDRFIWPHGMIDDPASGRFGYVMDLRPAGFVGLAPLLRGEVPRREDAVVRFAFELAMAFRDLHLRGLCYRDINFGNAFVDPHTGAALICDNDNVAVEGVTRARVLGARKFMAPEIVRGEALPSKYTDRYSLAVLLFYLLVVHHPLEGARTEIGLADAEAELSHYGTDPLFCFDPDDERNRPVRGLHDHVMGMWQALPSGVRALFVRSFTDGLRDPRRRVVDSEWCAALADMRTGLFTCASCGRACFLERGERPDACATCATATDELPVLDVDGQLVVLRPGAIVTGHHLHGDLDFDTVFATVERHPTHPERLGLRNDTAVRWTSVDQDGRDHDVAPGRRVTAVAGATIDAGLGMWAPRCI